MKLFKNIAEYKVFKSKYEVMGKLEEERLISVANDYEALRKFFEFMDDVRLISKKSEINDLSLEEELQSDIERQQVLARLTK